MQVCTNIESVRSDLGISEFMTMCTSQGLSRGQAFNFYINGKDVGGKVVNVSEHLNRGSALKELQEEWLGKW